MPITAAKGFRDSTGALHASVEEAQSAEMRRLLREIDGSALVGGDADKTLDTMANDLVNHKDELLAILTSGPRTRPKARKTPGTTNPKRAVKRVSQEVAKAHLQEAHAAVDTQEVEQSYLQEAHARRGCG